LLLISHIGVFGLIFAECSNTKNRQIPTLLKAHQLRLKVAKIISSILRKLACISSWI